MDIALMNLYPADLRIELGSNCARVYVQALQQPIAAA
jgi:hypothetical protein